MGLGQLGMNMEINKCQPLSFTTHKNNNLEIDHRPKEKK